MFRSTAGVTFICTDSFSSQEVNLLQSILLDKYNIHSTCVSNGLGKDQFRIRIAKRSMTDFQSLIAPHIPPMMKFRIGL